MRKWNSLGLAVAAVLALAGPAAADEAADARAVLDRAIAASGGKAKLAQFKAQTWNEKGTYYGMGKGQPYTGKYALQWPDQYRMEIEGVFTLVVNGDKGWIKSGKETTEMTKEMLAAEKDNLHAGWVASLLPLEDKAYTLAPLPETKVEDRPAVGVKVSRKGRGDVELYFDKKTDLLVKSAYAAKDQENKGKEVRQEVFFSDYRDVAGAKLPAKLVIKRDGKVYVEATNEDVKPAEKLEDKVFAKP